MSFRKLLNHTKHKNILKNFIAFNHVPYLGVLLMLYMILWQNYLSYLQHTTFKLAMGKDSLQNERGER